MSIPKTIHYCWFGRNPKPKLAEKCIKSWKKYCPDYEIIEWNEDNFDIASAPLYVRQAYEAQKWAFVTDYVRLRVVYDHGGIYLDVDVELIKPLDSFLNYTAYFGFENEENIATGLGFGATKGTHLLLELMEDYEQRPFVLPNGLFDLTPCPVLNTKIFVKNGLIQNNTCQRLDDDIVIFDTSYLCPKNYTREQIRYYDNTVSIHWFSASWKSPKEKKDHIQRVVSLYGKEFLDYIVHTPNRVLKKTLGESRYNEFKRYFRR